MPRDVSGKQFPHRNLSLRESISWIVAVCGFTPAQEMTEAAVVVATALTSNVEHGFGCGPEGVCLWKHIFFHPNKTLPPWLLNLQSLHVITDVAKFKSSRPVSRSCFGSPRCKSLIISVWCFIVQSATNLGNKETAYAGDISPLLVYGA